MTDWDTKSYNVLPLEFPSSAQTAGSGLIAEMDRYYLSRTPSEKNACTGLMARKNLILILAEDWQAPAPDPTAAPGLYRMASEGVDFSSVYAPDWYQGQQGREFALLAGMTPTTIWGRPALEWVGQKQVYLPFALARGLASGGYICRAWPRQERPGSYETLGFSQVSAATTSDLDTLNATLEELVQIRPFFAYYVWSGQDCDANIQWLLWDLTRRGLEQDTAVCLVTGSAEERRGRLFLWGAGLAGLEVAAPCSELDVTPTLLNLWGLDYDARFLSGRDLFSGQTGPVSLSGSAYGDWVTDAGYYSVQENVFYGREGAFAGDTEAARYVRQARRQVYDNYIYARRVMENDYFQLLMDR